VARLVYSAITSLDGYVADRDGDFSWSAPDAEVHGFVNDLLRPVGTQLYGRRTYDVLVAWETLPTGPGEPAVVRDFARIWRSADKVVYSTTLPAVTSARTRLERDFDPDAVRRLVASADRDVSIGGPHLAARAFHAGLVDDVHLFWSPVLVGGGTSALPPGLRIDLEPVATHRFANGVVHLHYRVRRDVPTDSGRG
jgi:dihydrofolate reductase